MRAYGSGHFGHWITDEAGLPAYEYTCNHLEDPAAAYATPRGPSRDHFHLLGNAHASAIAHNEGHIELFRSDTGGAWLNRYAPARGAYAGGFGFLRLERRTTTTLYRHLGGAQYRRVFGVGYFRKSATWGDVAIDQVAFLPYGNDPVLAHLTTLSNRGLRPLNLSYYEYWEALVTPLPAGRGERWRTASPLRGRRNTRYDTQRRLLLSCPTRRRRWPRFLPTWSDPDPPVVFVAAIDGLPVAAFESSKAAFFGEGGLEAPEALQLPFLPGGTFEEGARSDRLALVLQREVAVPPRGQVTLAHLFGYGPHDSGRPGATGSATPAGLVERYAARPPTAWLRESLDRWRESLVRFETPCDSWVAREVAWSSYYGQALATLDARTGEACFVPGGTATFCLGRGASGHDPCRHALAQLPSRPAQVRGTIRHIVRLRRDGSLAELRRAREEGTAEAHLWLLWLIADYILLYRDRAFADQVVPLHPHTSRRTTTVRQQVRRSLDHLRQAVGVGPHGLLRLHSPDGDAAALAAGGLLARWKLYQHAESTYSSGLAGVVLPRVAELCRWLGERAWAEEVDRWAAENRRALAQTWNGHWFERLLTPGRPVGRDEMYLDCQPWVVLAGAASDTRQFILFHEIRERLAAHLPRLPSEEGPVQSPAGAPVADGLADGVSFATCGPLIWAWAQADPHAAWETLKACTLASHAEAFGRRWFGIWSAPESLDPLAHGSAGAPPWPQIPFLTDGAAGGFPIASGHAANQLPFAVARLAGLHPDAQGYRVEPRLPFARFNLATARLGLSRQEHAIGGYLIPQGNDAVLVRVALPEGLSQPQVQVDRRPVPAQVSDDGRQVSFRVFVRGGLRTEWQVTGEP